MINREDSALIARERQNRGPSNAPRATTPTTTLTSAKAAEHKTAAAKARAKSPLRAGSATPQEG